MAGVFNQEQKLLHHLVLHSNDVFSISLLEGQPGIALVLAQYAKVKHKKPLMLVSDFLMDQAFDHLDVNTPLDFSSGLCGIGWSVEFLLQCGYRKGNSLDICEVIDQKMMAIHVLYIEDLSLETGLEGWLHYLLAHIQGTLANGNAFTKEYLLEWYQKLLLIEQSQMRISESFNQLKDLFMRMYHGMKWCYEFNLSAFVNPTINLNKNLLGLREGVAGYIERHYL
ncbi:MAG: hypothetical protein IJV36_07545 [Prevotella sp.]|nr:hypothetical protein [Prevotella sp.]